MPLDGPLIMTSLYWSTPVQPQLWLPYNGVPLYGPQLRLLCNWISLDSPKYDFPIMECPWIAPIMIFLQWSAPGWPHYDFPVLECPWMPPIMISLYWSAPEWPHYDFPILECLCMATIMIYLYWIAPGWPHYDFPILECLWVAPLWFPYIGVPLDGPIMISQYRSVPGWPPLPALLTLHRRPSSCCYHLWSSVGKQL